MVEKITSENRGRFLFGSLFGEYTTADFALFSQSFKDAVEDFDGNCVLLDKRLFQDRFDYHDAMIFANSPITDFMVEKALRIAALVRPSRLDVEHSYETLMQNRSVNYRPFITLEDAMVWLLGQSDEFQEKSPPCGGLFPTIS